jgi:hypothetical protein
MLVSVQVFGGIRCRCCFIASARNGHTCADRLRGQKLLEATRRAAEAASKPPAQPALAPGGRDSIEGGGESKGSLASSTALVNSNTGDMERRAPSTSNTADMAEGRGAMTAGRWEEAVGLFGRALEAAATRAGSARDAAAARTERSLALSQVSPRVKGDKVASVL